MSDIYIPGLRSRFNSEKIVEDLMKLERVPKEKAEQNIETLETRKSWWQDLGRRVSSLRDSARTLFSFQNPFNERTAISSNDNIITATATREADEREYQFTVKQLAQADRFLSRPLDEKTTIDAGEYTFSLGKDEISFNFRGGSLREFADAVNRRGRDKIGASLITVQPGSRSLLLESKVTGAENRLGFSGNSLQLALQLGIVEPDGNTAATNAPALAPSADEGALRQATAAAADTDAAGEGENASGLAATATPAAATGPAAAASGTTAANTTAELAQGTGTGDDAELADAATATAAPAAMANYRPVNAVSTAQDAIVAMEGIEMTRPSNIISDIIPGVTVTARNVSDRAERIQVQADRDGIKDAIISLIGNYNRLMAELNVLTRADDRLVSELGYLDRDEADDMRKRLGAFSGDTTLVQLRSNLQRAVTSPYPTDAEQDLALLAQIGISTNTRLAGGAGYNPSQLRGYLEIDESALDTAIERNLPAIRQLFASSTTGEVIADTGVAVNLDSLARPFVETGGIIALKTGTIDSRITQDKRRIDSMERQLASKEADLKLQYSRMENAYARMEQMSTALDNFSQSNNNSR